MPRGTRFVAPYGVDGLKLKDPAPHDALLQAASVAGSLPPASEAKPPAPSGEDCDTGPPDRACPR